MILRFGGSDSGVDGVIIHPEGSHSRKSSWEGSMLSV